MPALGLFKRREIWFPTLRGWVVLLGFLLALIVGGILGTVPFLAPSQPNHDGILVVEGWLPDYALEEAKKTFETGRYRKIVVTGIPIDQGFYISKATNYAQLAAMTLRELGVSPERIVPIACPKAERDRTYATACQVRSWLQQQTNAKAVDVFTLGVHARRTWLLYSIAMKNEFPVGIIAGQDERYDPKRWWRTSAGVRTVTSEIIAYLYAKLFFFPPPQA